MLETCQSKYIDIGDNTYSIKSLYQGKSDRIIFAAITKAHVFSYGNPLDSVVELNLDDKALYFMVTTEPPRSFRYSDINCIYDSKGRNLLYNTRVRDKKRLEKVGNLVKNSYLYR